MKASAGHAPTFLLPAETATAQQPLDPTVWNERRSGNDAQTIENGGSLPPFGTFQSNPDLFLTAFAVLTRVSWEAVLSPGVTGQFGRISASPEIDHALTPPDARRALRPRTPRLRLRVFLGFRRDRHVDCLDVARHRVVLAARRALRSAPGGLYAHVQASNETVAHYVEHLWMGENRADWKI
jgi:hypothetical protein